VSYIGLGSRGPNTAATDTTGLNTGNYTNSFTPAALATNVPYFEIYHMIVSNVPIGANAQIVVNNKSWGFTNPLIGSEWDPSQPLLMNPTDEIDFLWSIAASGQAPLVTVWLRYDPVIQPYTKAQL
jgi:hypothetical protein